MKLSDDELRIAHRVASILLSYPDEALLEQLDLLRQATAPLPAPVGEPLARMLAHAAATPLAELAAGYVEMFDLRRRCSPYLTYYTYGDTRKRGYALLRFKHAYRAGGLELTDEELADHLAVVLEFSACGDPREAGRLLREHRAGLELLWRALDGSGSPYADVVAAVRATLPEPGPREAAAALKLAREGPPIESVGLISPDRKSPDRP